MRARGLLRSTLAAALLLLLSCAGTTAYAGRQRAVRGPAQWNHEWSRGAVFYEVFVRSFADSNGDGNGDLNGLISRLDYLTDLGIDAIWLMPVFQSPSYHGYDATDYETIEKDYGTNADFQRLLDEAHKRGIRVIIDFVMNHTSSDHPWFLESASSPASPKRDWYVWRADNPGWNQPWGGTYPTWYLKNGSYYYGLFWSGMPDLNYRSAAMKAEMFRIARNWLNAGVDGFRLDATRYLVEDGGGAGQADTPETHQILKEFAAMVRSVKPDATLVAENTVDTQTLATYYGSTATVRGGDEMPMNFDFPLAHAIVESVNSGNAAKITATLRDVTNDYPPGIIDAPFLTNHDDTRLATVLANDSGKLRSAAAILLTLPGAPFLYYGEEVGLQNGPTSADESKRTPMPWSSKGGFTTGTPWFGYAAGISTANVATETNDPSSLLSYYRKWIAVRKSSVALLTGEIAPIEASAEVLAFIRDTAEEHILVVHNLSNSTVRANFALRRTVLDKVYADEGVGDPARATGGWTVALPPHTSGVWRVQ